MANLGEFEPLNNLLEWVTLLPMRLRARARSRSRYKARAQALASTRHTLEHLTKSSVESHRIVFNVALYLLLLDQDLADFTEDMVCAVGTRKRAFIAKHEAILLYEASEDITQLLGKEFRGAIEALGTPADQVSRLNSVTSGMNRFWRENREFLRGIRIMLSAHRHQDALLYLQNLEELKPLEVMACAVDLSKHIEQVANVVTNIASAASGPGPILKDMLKSMSKQQTNKIQ